MTSNASTRATIFLYDAEPTRRLTVLAYVCFDHVQLRCNVALKFDATFNVIVLRSLTRTVRHRNPISGPRAVRLHPLGSRGLETRYVGWMAIRQRVAVGPCGSLV
jgi:hypothetical protein